MIGGSHSFFRDSPSVCGYESALIRDGSRKSLGRSPKSTIWAGWSFVKRRVFSDGGVVGQWAGAACLAIMHNHTIVFLFRSLIGVLRSTQRARADLVCEDLALRWQMVNSQRTSGSEL